MRFSVELLATISCLLFTSLLAAQEAPPPPIFNRPAAAWQTLRTEHFEVHHPEELADWSRAMTARLEAMRAMLLYHTGFFPARTRIVIDETGHLSGGMSFPMGGLIFLWPEQQMPHLGRAHERPELLVVHELAHKADSRPSRHRLERLFLRLIPPPWNVSPRGLATPRWVSEGHPSHLEGAVAGGGLPHSALRAAFLRQRALEGRLPNYDELDGTTGFYGSRLPYAFGSAFFEWLSRRHGDEALRRLWIRTSDPDRPSFDAAFTEVFGSGPRSLYAEFVADLETRARRAGEILSTQGLVEGETASAAGVVNEPPAFSPDGRYLAMVERERGGRSRVVIRASSQGLPGAGAPLAVLPSVRGRAHGEPRFLPNGDGVLLVRREPLADGTLRPDLFLWEWSSGALRRITRSAAIHSSDPSPDGRTAVADRCLRGTCDLVLVDLTTGVMRTLAEGGPFLAYSRPRWHPDGRSLVAARNDGGRWRVVLFDSLGAAARAIDPDDGVDRYAPVFTPAGELIAVSERGGIQNLVRLDPDARREAPLTRVTGAAVAPTPHPDGGLYFLRLHADGLALARLPADGIRPLEPVALPPQLAPAVPPSRSSSDAFAEQPVGPARPYVIGPRAFGLLPTGTFSAAGRGLGLAITNTDPVGRLTFLLQQLWADGAEGWHGTAVGVAYRGFRPALAAEAFSARQGTGDIAAEVLAASYRGGAAYVSLDHLTTPVGYGLRLGGSHGRLVRPGGDVTGRSLGFLQGRTILDGSRHRGSMQAALSGSVGGGVTQDSSWLRVIGVVSGSAHGGSFGVDTRAFFGTVSPGAPAFEHLAAGGVEPALFDAALHSHRLVMPALPDGALRGRQLVGGRLAFTGLPVEPYLWAAFAEGFSGDRQQVLGLERTLIAPHLPFARLPGLARMRAGVGYAFGGASEDRFAGYATLLFRP